VKRKGGPMDATGYLLILVAWLIGLVVVGIREIRRR
jgi:hypothetical protein